MAKIKNPVVVAGQQATLITKNITANGDYSASADNADGYSGVHVEVPTNQPVYYATLSGIPYVPKISIPETVGTATYKNIEFYGAKCPNLEEFESLSPYLTVLNKSINRPEAGETAETLKFHRLFLPFVNTINGFTVTFVNASVAQYESGFAQFGSVGHPVISINSAAFFNNASSSGKGQGWEIHIYTSATTLADAATALPYAPWGANQARIVYHNSATGEVIEE